MAGMGAYQLSLHVPHPPMIESELVHGIWFGICLGMELIGLYFIVKSRKQSR